jgi:hypothetical protein
MRTHWLNTWRTAALLLVVVTAVINVLHMAQKVLPPAQDASAAATDPVTCSERRFARLRERVRELHITGTVGYVGDMPGDRLTADARAVEDYYLAQFALVPLVLDLNADVHDWAVANMRTTAPAARVPVGWKIVEDFGAGIILLRKATP